MTKKKSKKGLVSSSGSSLRCHRGKIKHSPTNTALGEMLLAAQFSPYHKYPKYQRGTFLKLQSKLFFFFIITLKFIVPVHKFLPFRRHYTFTLNIQCHFCFYTQLILLFFEFTQKILGILHHPCIMDFLKLR